MQDNYFSTLSNNAQSFKQKLDMIKLICFLTQVMKKKNPEKYPDALTMLGVIFNVDLHKIDQTMTGDYSIIRAFGLICDDLLWGTNDDIEKPEGYSNAKEIKDKIINYFTEEWAPF